MARFIGLPPETLVFQRQVHGTGITEGREALPPRRWRSLNQRDLPESDILITDLPRQILVLSVADCCPILLFSPSAGAVAAVHAGRRGTAAGAAGLAVEALDRRFGASPAGLHVWIGPCAGGGSYEVGPEVAAEFSQYPDYVKGSRNGSDRYLLDLPGINRRQLLAAGVTSSRINDEAEDTIRDRRFHSYRRDGADSGRMAAWIGLRR